VPEPPAAISVVETVVETASVAVSFSVVETASVATMQSPRSVTTWSADSFLSEGSERDELQVLKNSVGRYRVDLNAIVGDQASRRTRAGASEQATATLLVGVAATSTPRVATIDDLPSASESILSTPRVATIVQAEHLAEPTAAEHTVVEQAGQPATVDHATMATPIEHTVVEQVGQPATVDHATIMYDGTTDDNDDNVGEDELGRASRRRLSPMLINALFGEFGRRTEHRLWRGGQQFGPWVE
jgi:hypothetical protein